MRVFLTFALLALTLVSFGTARAQGVNGSLAMCPTATAGVYQPCYPYNITAPLVSQVTTGGTAVQAFAAYGAIKGGYIYNPTTVTTNLCIAVGATAASTTGGATSCVPPGYTFTIAPTAQAVSVNSADSAHAFSGAGYQ